MRRGAPLGDGDVALCMGNVTLYSPRPQVADSTAFFKHFDKLRLDLLTHRHRLTHLMGRVV